MYRINQATDAVFLQHRRRKKDNQVVQVIFMRVPENTKINIIKDK